MMDRANADIEYITLNKRVRELIDYFTEGNCVRFAALININRNRVFQIVEHEGANPTFSFFFNVMKYLPDVNLEWLVAGRGKMLRKNTTKEISLYETENKKLEDECKKRQVDFEKLEAQFYMLSLMYEQVTGVSVSIPKLQEYERNNKKAGV